MPLKVQQVRAQFDKFRANNQMRNIAFILWAQRKQDLEDQIDSTAKHFHRLLIEHWPLPCEVITTMNQQII
ncbi:MAG: hypothetical protein CFE43_06820 [Burkholderiales bacterium PBB3]|nr:MAG: hypothetical protein CFE43_06820 [Burkholderiales bacterium PBB3]